MSGSESSLRDAALAPPPPPRPAFDKAADPATDAAADSPLLNFSVHSLPSPAADRSAERTTRGRRQMLAVLLVCAAPVVASYAAYFGLRPQAKTNYGELVSPPRPLPGALGLRTLRGDALPASDLRGQWLLVVVAGGACDPGCEQRLLLQRQLHQTLGNSRDRVDKVWLIDDAAAPRPETLHAIAGDAAPGTPAPVAAAMVLRAEPAALAEWLKPAGSGAAPDAAGTSLYIVDPRGDFMLREPASPEPARVKRDIDRLLRASAGWDRAGR